MEYQRVKVLFNKEIVSGIFKMVVHHPNEAKAGQFYMLKYEGTTFLPRPISVCERDDNTVTFLYAAVGNGTREFSKLVENQYINITGPLGNGFDIGKEYGKVALVSGGIGTAPMLELAKKLRENNPHETIDFYAGFRDDIFLVNELCQYTNQGYVSTDTGKYGHKGFITDLLQVEKYDTVLCCGPEVMMKKVVSMCKEKNVAVYVSMEKHMACGVGACLVCTCKTKSGNKRTCKDGPVFNGYDIEL